MNGSGTHGVPSLAKDATAGARRDAHALKFVMRQRELRRLGFGVELPQLAPLVCPLGCPGVPSVQCAPHCAAVLCATLKKGAPKLPWLAGLLRSLRPHAPPHPPPRAGPTLLLITITFPHAEQLLKLEHCAHALVGEPGVLWVVAEDAASPSPFVGALLNRSGLVHVHLAHGPTRQRGNAQRDAALRYIREQRLEGVVYNMDDDNAYAPAVWNELRAVRPGRVGVLAVRRAVFPPPRCDGRFFPLRKVEQRKLRVDRPLYDATTGLFAGFDSGWCRPSSWMSRKLGPRKFCVDMGGFAFDAALLRRTALQRRVWDYIGHADNSDTS